MYRLALLVLVGLMAGRIAATWTALSHTPDEPVHLAAGMEWLQQGSYRLHAENPPLARVATALGPHLAGLRLASEGPIVQRGLDVLYAEGSYARNLSLARLGTLPFFLLAALLVWRWAASLGGPRAGFLAGASFCTLPPVLGHAGLATTDMAFAAVFPLALYTFARWLDSPTAGRSLAFGAALGVALATKFSALVFFPPCAAALVLLRLVLRRTAAPDVERTRPAARARSVLLAAAAVGVVLWAGYRFSFGAPGSDPRAAAAIERGLPGVLARVPLPAPEAVHGLALLRSHVQKGHGAYLLGRESPDGFAAFYPVALLVKTPLAFLALAAAGLFGLLCGSRGRGWTALAPAAAATAIVLTAVFSTINIGLRHVLVVYPLLAVSIGVGGEALLRRTAGRLRRAVGVGAALLLGWQALLALAVQPDSLGTFNPLAGREPGRILVDSDLDWGQDVLQLAEFCREREIERLSVALFGNARLCEHDLPPLRWLQPGERVTGWVAISEMYYRDHWRRAYDDPCERRVARPYEERGVYAWLAGREPEARVGSSIRVYHLPQR